jgi:uncharacterized protein YjiS (DUF1127 family)
MMRNAASINDLDFSHFGWVVRATLKSSAKSVRYFVALMKKAAAHERGRRQLAELDVHMLQDIGLEPFDVYYGWRSPGR